MERDPEKDQMIGEILVEEGVITPLQMQEASVVQREKGGYLCTVIIKMGFAASPDVFGVLSKQLGVGYVDLKKETVDLKAVEKVPAKLAFHYKLMPYRFEDKKLVVALVDPLDVHKLDDVKLLLDIEIKPMLGYEDDILEAIQKYYGMGAEILEEIMAREDVGEKMTVEKSFVEDLETAVEDASIIKFVNQIFTQAVEERATDVHLEPFENELKVRFRIDGFLYEVPIPDSIKLFHPAIVSRVKIMAELDIAEHRIAQDGRIKIRIQKGKELDLRVSVLPSSYGEAVHIRILSQESFMEMEKLGLHKEDQEKFKVLINKPHGIIFVTGPTGSGKSTTLYACLKEKNLPHIKIITTEDPVEYQLRGITQIQVNPKIGLNFSEVLRCILRHDPDIIMVGEVRDRETAEITIRSAMTGHLVFSTLHTNNAANAPARLIDMGIEPFLVASSLDAVIAQRLVRVICQQCRKATTVPGEIFRKEGIDVRDDHVEVFEGEGCEFCHFTGFKGRTAIFEMLTIDEEIRDLIFQRVTSQMIKEKALASGMHTLRQDGFKKVLDGITALSEVLRVT